ncbi:MAG TPA: hypothetical protein VEA80_01390 [Vitreimonas sp.]|uniref:hypothetical protein n=1 Tax=Vitreimonas sp. TaxID=3069702 RepID=UPI002D4DB452|nr:hypothetical protein [Vitreimonas sp.]HYD86105.1 hypothetical protein [Vitreimonas sp.]
MGLWILFALQLAATGLGFVYLLRRQRQLEGDVERLRAELAAADSRAAAPRRRAQGAVTPVDADVVTLTPPPSARAAQAWRSPGAPLQVDAPQALPSKLRGVILGVVAAAPALAFLFGVTQSAIIASGLAVALAMILLALRSDWSASAWAGVITGAGWALAGFVLGVAHASPVVYSVFVAFCGVAGLAHAQLRRAAPGSAMALVMASMSLALASQIGIIGAAGAAFGLIVTAAAITGALSLRLETLHLAAFGAALIGLFVLSGQTAAAIWFTPAAAWAGAIFLAIAFVRAPQLGPRGVAIAGTGALAPLLAIGALHYAGHGLADRFAAAGALVALAATLGGLIALAALRRRGGLAALRVTLWVLAIAAFAALSGAILLALPAPFAALAFAAAALGLSLLNARLPDAAWRSFACIAALAAAVLSIDAAQLLLNESPIWPAWALLVAGIGVPGLLLAFGAAFADRAHAPFTAGLFETIAFVAGVCAASLVLRLYFSAGATLLSPIGFVEAGAHIAVWLAASLVIASRSRRGSAHARMGVATLLGLMALGALLFIGALWLTPYWSVREAAAASAHHAPLGFLAPAIVAFAHWVFWRARGAETRTRLAFGAGAAGIAAFIALEVLRGGALPDWASALIAAVSFALAIVVNFAPGVVGHGPRGSYGEKYLHRNRRRQQRA